MGYSFLKNHFPITLQLSNIIYITLNLFIFIYDFCLFNTLFLENVMITLPESYLFLKICLEQYSLSSFIKYLHKVI